MQTQILKLDRDVYLIYLRTEDIECAFMDSQVKALKAAPVGSYDVDVWAQLTGNTPECNEPDHEEERDWRRANKAALAAKQ